MEVERRLQDWAWSCPRARTFPVGVKIPFAWVRVRGNRAFASGHGALDANGTAAGPFGRVPDNVSLTDAQCSARLAVLALLSSLKAALGDLDRVTAWLMVNGHVNAEPGFGQTTAVINPASELILHLYGPDAGAHGRTAIGVAALPLNLPVVVAAEVEIAAS